ncbi:MAG: hypothetical protein QM758_18710 [Armatimonas sp.]
MQILYGLGVVAGIVLPGRTSMDSMVGMAIGGGCLGALGMAAVMRHLRHST